MIRQIGVSDFGLYSLVISFISYFILDLGLNEAVQRFIAKYRAEGNEDKIEKMVGITTKVYLIIDTVIFFVLLIVYFFLANIFTGLTPDEISKLKGLYTIAAVFSIMNFIFKPMAGVMMAFEYFVEERILEMVNKVGLVLLISLALYFGAGVYALVLINGAVSLIVSIAKFVVFKRKSGLHIQWNYYNKNELKGIFSFSMWTFGSGIAQRMRFSLIPTVLGILSNSTEIALFSLGSQLEGMVYILSSGLNGLFLPKVSRFVHEDDQNQVLRLMIRVGRLQLYLICLIFFGFLIFGHDFIQLWVGNDFRNVYYILLLLIVSNIVSLTQHINVNLVYVENKVKETATRILITSAIGLIVACLLAPRFGALGCAVGTGLGLCIYLVWINSFYHNKMGIDIKSFFKECHLKIVPPIVIFSVVSFIVASRFTFDTWSKLFLALFVFGILYLLICWLLIFNKEEKNLVVSIFHL